MAEVNLVQSGCLPLLNKASEGDHELLRVAVPPSLLFSIRPDRAVFFLPLLQLVPMSVLSLLVIDLPFVKYWSFPCDTLQVGHLHAGCAKDITVTLKSSVPVTFKMHTVKCKVCRITFQLPADQVSDWDDRLHTVKWVDATRSLPNACPTKKKVRSRVVKANVLSTKAF